MPKQSSHALILVDRLCLIDFEALRNRIVYSRSETYLASLICFDQFFLHNTLDSLIVLVHVVKVSMKKLVAGTQLFNGYTRA